MLAEQPIESLLELIAARTPAPGGGSAAACTVAVAAALEQMAAAFTSTPSPRPTDPPDPERQRRAEELRATAGELRATALALAERELSAYGALLQARRLPEREPGRERRIARADEEAIAAPLELCRCAGRAAELGAELVDTGHRNLVGDAICATLLAEAACRAAATLVRLNLDDRPGDERAAEAQALAERALEARRRALG